jgi:hypothetical protein
LQLALGQRKDELFGKSFSSARSIAAIRLGGGAMVYDAGVHAKITTQGLKFLGRLRMN